MKKRLKKLLQFWMLMDSSKVFQYQKMKTTLIALFSNTWNVFWDENDPKNGSVFERKQTPSYFLCNQWKKLINPDLMAEIAVFQDSLSDPLDFYPPNFRRFKQVGEEFQDKIRNLFELGFEKGYDRILFMDPLLIFHFDNLLEDVLSNWAKNTVLFIPQMDGKVALCGMEEAHFWDWQNFNFHKNEEVVELISDCNAKKIPFKIMPSCDLKEIELNFYKKFNS